MLDRNRIEDIAASVCEHDVLRNHCIEEARCRNADGSPVDYRTEMLPSLTLPPGARSAWWAERGLIRNPDSFHVYYHAIARLLQPKAMLEIGVWWGYALMAMVTGTLYPQQKDKGSLHVYGFDLENYPGAENCLAWCSKALGEIGVTSTMVHCNSRDFDPVGLPVTHTIDLASVDGEHDYDNAFKDLLLCHPHMAANGVIIVDDCGWALNVRAACEDFAREYNYSQMMLPTLKGSMVLTKNA